MRRIVDILSSSREHPSGEVPGDHIEDKDILRRVLGHIRHQDRDHRIVRSLHLHAILAYAVSSPLIDDLFDFLNNRYERFTRLC